MEQPKFKVGDVVHLKSGGVAMTVEEVGSGSMAAMVRCTWFTGKGPQFATQWFATDALKVSNGT